MTAFLYAIIKKEVAYEEDIFMFMFTIKCMLYEHKARIDCLFNDYT